MSEQTLIPGANAALTTTNITVRIDSDTALDTAVWRLAANGKVRGDGDMIFYNQPTSDDGSVHYLGAHRYRLDLARQPEDIHYITIACTANLPLAQYRQLALYVDDGDRVLHCPVALDGRRETALILGVCYRRDGIWKFRFVAQGFHGGLRPLCEHFGIEVADDTPAKTTAPATKQPERQPPPAAKSPDDKPAKPQKTPPQNPLHGTDWSESNRLASAEQHQPLADWLAAKNISPQFNHAAVDMRGYYDEAAALLGKHYPLLKELLGQMNWAYRHRHHGIKHDLKKYPPADAQRLQNLCRTLYQNTLLARCHYHKGDKSLHIQLQQAQPVRQFFGGGWLEWFALGELLQLAAKRGADYRFSCARNITITTGADEKHELDVMYLPLDKTPLVIECKSGEYRGALDKHLTLCKRLGLPASHYLILATDLDTAQAKALGAMYPLTFVTPHTLRAHCQPLL